jgi:hypothetical protein
MGDIRSIGPRPVPDDQELSEFILDLLNESCATLDEKMEELRDAISETLSNGQPRVFAYAKLLNYLNTQEVPQLIYLCACAMWKINEADKDGV